MNNENKEKLIRLQEKYAQLLSEIDSCYKDLENNSKWDEPFYESLSKARVFSNILQLITKEE
ncbi:hypothetical protein ABE547_03445 [Dorea sp. YH-dor226]|uniref:hypothetical protein n=1 Tax=Dorea sp. YH-dor226 TaxID=3151119 RepID=UPI0032422CF8